MTTDPIARARAGDGEAFRELTDMQTNGWQLHFAGSVASDDDSRSAVESLINAAAGLPVEFHFDAKFDQLRSLYRRASLYWHATGYGVSAQEEPQAQEHFGNTTIEAMSAGAVPIVINSGGQTEIVSHGADGFLWDSPAELSGYTVQLATDRALMMRMSDRALAASTRFSRAAFIHHLETVIAQMSEPSSLKASRFGRNIGRETATGETETSRALR